MNFEWDENKNLYNQMKHGITFDEAKSVFYDENALLEYDNLHSEYEDRFRILGKSCNQNILLVVHCLRENETVIRIISSRKATANEKTEYERSINV